MRIHPSKSEIQLNHAEQPFHNPNFFTLTTINSSYGLSFKCGSSEQLPIETSETPLISIISQSSWHYVDATKHQSI